jgi:hypothetical protein
MRWRRCVWEGRCCVGRLVAETRFETHGARAVTVTVTSAVQHHLLVIVPPPTACIEIVLADGTKGCIFDCSSGSSMQRCRCV